MNQSIICCLVAAVALLQLADSVHAQFTPLSGNGVVDANFTLINSQGAHVVYDGHKTSDSVSDKLIAYDMKEIPFAQAQAYSAMSWGIDKATVVL